MRLQLHRPRYADIAATLALLIATTGTAYAVTVTQIGTADIADGAVTNPKLALNAVSNSKITAGAVSNSKILDGSITETKIADFAVTKDKIGVGAVSNTKLGANSVSTSKIMDGTVTTAKIQPGGITTALLQDGAVTSAKLAIGAVSSSRLLDGAVSTAKLLAGSVTHTKLAADSVSGINVIANSLTLADIAGADKSGSISFSLAANTCGTLSLSVSGAEVGQVAVMSWTGNTAVPTKVVFGPLKVVALNSITVNACNLGATAVSVTGLGVRVITFG